MKNTLLSGLILALNFFIAPAQALTLKNGSPFDSIRDQSLPRDLIILTYQGGPSLIDTKYQGLTSILTDMFAEGPASMTGDAYREKLFLLNAKIDVNSGINAMYLVVKAPPENIRGVVKLAREVIENPKLTPEIFERSKEKVLDERTQSEDSMSSLLFYTAFRDMFDYHPFTLDGKGSKTAISNVTLDLIKKVRGKLLDPATLFVSAGGPTAPEVIVEALNKEFLPDTAPKYKKVQAPKINIRRYIKNSDQLVVTLIHKPKATDNQILFVYPSAVKKDDAEFIHGSLAHEILGGGLNGRLGDILRTQRGLTYTASSFLGRSLPVWGVYTFGGVDQTLGLLTGVGEVINGFKKETLKISELNEARMSKESDFKESFELPLDKILEQIRYRVMGLNPKFLETYIANLLKADLKQVKTFIDKKVTLKDGRLYMVGDKEVVLPLLEKFGVSKSKVRVLEIDQIL